ncbi:MAG: hypothetical protein M3R13_09775 [Armatimonadota bacterium]|nr:hypothetical protein [Armatimonadota bacterium]
MKRLTGWLVAGALIAAAGCTDGGQFLPTQIVFTSDRGGTNQIYIMKANGDDVRQISTGTQAVDASMSAPGTKITYAKIQDGVWRIFLNNHTGTNEQIRFDGLTRADQHSPKLNRSGSRIVFVIGLGPDQEIWRMDSSGNNLISLTDSAFANSMPNFTPSSKVVFVSNRTGDNEIWLMEGDGADPVQLTTDLGDDTMPATRPTGDAVIFSSNRTGTYQLYTMKSDGTDLAQLTTSAGNKFGASYSMDGHKVFFYSDATGNMDIYSIDENGANETNLTNNAANDTKVGTLVAP